MILDRINQPRDLKSLNNEEMELLAEEIRYAILNRVSKNGGHVGPNLGVVELTIALHYVFNSPIDKIVYDVSHQCYPHKIITGRKEGFLNPEQFNKVSGYTNPAESEHDIFKVGHTSTSVSLACGLAKARNLKGDNENIIAVIGDGSLSGGEAFEGLDNAAELNSNFIIVVNDNDISIAPNYGGIYKNLKLLRDTEGKAECNFFKAMGLDYCYVKDGNNLQELIKTFEEIKDIDHPIVVHINTVKGKGKEYIEKNKEAWHWSVPFDLETGTRIAKGNGDKTYTQLTADFLYEKAKSDKKVMVITPATANILDFTPKFREDLGEQFIDVGIAEEHAIAYASGLAKNGAKPVVGIHSSFMQRAYDQLSQDLAINKNPAVILVVRGGISSSDVTHLGMFDIPLASNIPNIVYLAPTCKQEYFAMLEWGIEQKEYPVMIRVPNTSVTEKDITIEKDYSNLNKYKIEKQGEKVAIIALGNFYELGEKVKKELKEQKGINATLVNPRYITGIDEDVLEKLKENHKIVITLEDGILDGGFGEKITRFYGDSNMKVLNFGAKKEFIDRTPLNELYTKYHLTEELIVSDIMTVIEK
ncbi:MAG: 1-deoxy-D-xylulose-5-phosphate synthase [Clostridiales bacterium]|nr:1-deoxy-D-xylulose-5-phosphate synthase [Clostridiales bacterium]